MTRYPLQDSPFPAPAGKPVSREEFLSGLEKAVSAIHSDVDAERLKFKVTDAMVCGLITSDESRKIAILLEKLRRTLVPPHRSLLDDFYQKKSKK
ncbi:MAG: hypothetical protein G8345_16465 [Magnetococcales bacterium]|nr:hypothetical protein [Magnetococcales bacterium]NGZ28470.1 hypothetical protein [Magnetococcales bacterium]